MLRYTLKRLLSLVLSLAVASLLIFAVIEVAPGVTQEAWTFDVDCRESYQKLADALFEQYTQTSAELVDRYAREVGPGKTITTDAGVALRAPEAAHEVPVGRRGLDHHGQGILFVDDDAPCYVRVVGPGAERRLAVAQLVARNLREANAPMTPHTTPVMPAAAP